MRRFLVICAFFLLFASCQKKTTFWIYPDVAEADFSSNHPLPSDYVSPCTDPLNYVPAENYTDRFKKRMVRINFHFPDDSSRMNNFNPGEGEVFFSNMVNNANFRLDTNEKMNLPEGNNTPVVHPQFGLKINQNPTVPAFFYETDNDLAYFVNKGKDRNNYSRSIITKYAIQDDTVLNAFIMPHHPDSLKSKKYKTFGSGIALGSSIKLAGIYQLGGEDWAYATLLNHEVGHVFGLNHSWTTDGCDDTPKHPNCFYSSGVPPCDGAVSNNLMDYNNSQMALTPCQIGKIHMKISDTSAFQRKLIIPEWCNLDTTHTIVITEEENWPAARDVSHNIVIQDGGHLILNCRLSMPPNSSITVEPGGVISLYKTVLHNDCGKLWKGIIVKKSGNKIGKINTFGQVDIYNTKSVDL